MKRLLQATLILMTLCAITVFAKNPKYASSHYKYICVFVKNDKTQQMDSAMSLANFRKIIKQRWIQGYDIGEVKYGSGKWIGVFTKTSHDSHQTYVMARRWTAVNNLLDEYWKKGYYVTNIEHGLSECLSCQRVQ